jgi:CRP/FNR family transcriptional activator FtrB
MRDSDLQVVHDLPLFRGVSASHFADLTKASFLQRFPANVVLIHEGDTADFLHVVVEGMVALFSTHRREETIVSFCHPVSTFILAAVVTSKPYLMSARTTVASRILMIPSDAIRSVFSVEPVFARAVVDELAERYRDMVRELKNQKLRTSLQRLAAWILVNGAPSNGTFRAAIPYEKGTLASRLGITRENLSRHFATLQQYGVDVSGREILVKDRPALEKLARLDRLIDERGS